MISKKCPYLEKDFNYIRVKNEELPTKLRRFTFNKLRKPNEIFVRGMSYGEIEELQKVLSLQRSMTLFEYIDGVSSVFKKTILGIKCVDLEMIDYVHLLLISILQTFDKPLWKVYSNCPECSKKNFLDIDITKISYPDFASENTLESLIKSGDDLKSDFKGYKIEKDYPILRDFEILASAKSINDETTLYQYLFASLDYRLLDKIENIDDSITLIRSLPFKEVVERIKVGVENYHLFVDIDKSVSDCVSCKKNNIYSEVEYRFSLLDLLKGLPSIPF